MPSSPPAPSALSLHDALPISTIDMAGTGTLKFSSNVTATGSGAKTLNLIGSTAGTGEIGGIIPDRKSTRLNSSHLVISYAVFCLQKKKNLNTHTYRQNAHQRA